MKTLGIRQEHSRYSKCRIRSTKLNVCVMWSSRETLKDFCPKVLIRKASSSAHTVQCRTQSTAGLGLLQNLQIVPTITTLGWYRTCCRDFLPFIHQREGNLVSSFFWFTLDNICIKNSRHFHTRTPIYIVNDEIHLDKINFTGDWFRCQRQKSFVKWMQ